MKVGYTELETMKNDRKYELRGCDLVERERVSLSNRGQRRVIDTDRVDNI